MTHLFVYGTLRPAASDPLGRRARDRLFAQSTLVGTASVTGRLYDLGTYPGLWREDGITTRVSGYVLELAAPFATFAWLDRYEGNEYHRLVCPVALEAGGRIEAWLYALHHRPAAPVVATGDWLDVAAERAAPLKPRASSRTFRYHRSRM